METEETKTLQGQGRESTRQLERRIRERKTKKVSPSSSARAFLRSISTWWQKE